MKRILALLLIFSMMTVYGTVIFAAGETMDQSSVGEPYGYKIDTVIRLGLMDTELSGEFLSMSEVTRMDMVIALYRAFNYDNMDTQPVADKMYYKDVDNLHYASGYLAALTDLGIVSGYPDGTFRPNDVVALKDAYVMCMRSLGYAPAEMANDALIYMNAKKSGLDKGINKNGAEILNRGDMATILYNMLFAEYYDVSMLNNYGQAMKSKGLFIETVMELSCEEGILTGIGGVSLYDEILSEDRIMLNDKQLRNTLGFSDEYLGYFATVIYDEETQEAKAIVFPKENNVISFDTELMKSYSGGTYTYYSDETSNATKRAQVDKTADILYNDYVCFDYSRMTPEYGKVVLIDNDGDKSFDVVRVYEYTSVPVVNVSEDAYGVEIAVKQQNDTVNIYRLNDYDKYRIYSATGSVLKPSSISLNSIATICEADKNLITLYISNKSVEGQASVGGGSRIVRMEDGSEYKLLENVYLKGWDGASPGRVKLYLDVNGYVAAAMTVLGDGDTTSGGDWKYGYIFRSAFDKKGITGSLCIKLLSQNNEMLYLDIGDKIYIDDVLYKNMENANNAIWNAYGQFQDTDSAGKERTTVRLIRYYQREDGVVTKLDTPIEQSLYDSQTPSGYNKNDCLMLRAKGKMLAKRLGIRSFKTISGSNAEVLGEINFADANKPVFIIPATTNGTEKDEDYVATTIGNVTNIREKNYYVSGYNISPGELYADVAVIKSGLAINDIYKIAVVSEICKMLDDEDNVRDAVSAHFDGGNCVSYCVKDTSAVAVESLKPGDVIQYYMESGEVVVEQILYRHGGDGILNSSSTNANGEAGADGGGISLNGNVAVLSKVLRRTDAWLNVEGPKQLPILIPLFPKVQFFDIQSGESRVGTSWDIRTVDQYGERADIFIYSFNGYNPVDAVAIRISK